MDPIDNNNDNNDETDIFGDDLDEQSFGDEIFEDEIEEETLGDEIFEDEIEEQSIALDEQPETIVNELSTIEALQPENWQTLNETERLSAIQDVENRIAEIQGRPPVEIDVNPDAPEGLFGGYDPNTNSIEISGWHINDNNIQEIVDTIAHEGRHAYQNHAINTPGFHPNEAEVESWRDNFVPGNYLDAETYGQELYEGQPVEADAWQNGSRISEMLYGPKS